METHLFHQANKLYDVLIHVSYPQVIWMSTFHSMCVRILRRDADRIGIERNFTIIDPTDQKSVIKDVLKNENIDSTFDLLDR